MYPCTNAALAQSRVVGYRVGDPVFLPRDMAAAVLVQLEGQQDVQSSAKEQTFYADPRGKAISRLHATRFIRLIAAECTRAALWRRIGNYSGLKVLQLPLRHAECIADRRVGIRVRSVILPMMRLVRHC